MLTATKYKINKIIKYIFYTFTCTFVPCCFYCVPLLPTTDLTFTYFALFLSYMYKIIWIHWKNDVQTTPPIIEITVQLFGWGSSKKIYDINATHFHKIFLVWLHIYHWELSIFPINNIFIHISYVKQRNSNFKNI